MTTMETTSRNYLPWRGTTGRVSRLAAVRVGLSEQKQLVAGIAAAPSLLGVCDGWKLDGTS